ncbi:hypothetical protein [Kitasatospora sp. NPDC059462]|uniref:hypothetical protein n=1 Tax=Kitasatospora sp. NPDC059462 TaxID=3346841 RepID=UPI0036CF9EB6
MLAETACGQRIDAGFAPEPSVVPADEAARVRYLDHSSGVELSGGSRRPADAATRIVVGLRAFDVPNDPFVEAAHALLRGERFPPLVLVGEGHDDLVCLEGHLRLTAHALVGGGRPHRRGRVPGEGGGGGREGWARAPLASGPSGSPASR